MPFSWSIFWFFSIVQKSNNQLVVSERDMLKAPLPKYWTGVKIRKVLFRIAFENQAQMLLKHIRIECWSLCLFFALTTVLYCCMAAFRRWFKGCGGCSRRWFWAMDIPEFIEYAQVRICRPGRECIETISDCHAGSDTYIPRVSKACNRRMRSKNQSGDGLKAMMLNAYILPSSHPRMQRCPCAKARSFVCAHFATNFCMHMHTHIQSVQAAHGIQRHAVWDQLSARSIAAKRWARGSRWGLGRDRRKQVLAPWKVLRTAKCGEPVRTHCKLLWLGKRVFWHTTLRSRSLLPSAISPVCQSCHSC